MGKETNFVELYRDHHDFIEEILAKLKFLVEATSEQSNENLWGLNIMRDLIIEAEKM